MDNWVDTLYKIAMIIGTIVTIVILVYANSGSDVETTLIFSAILVIVVWLMFVTIMLFKLKHLIDYELRKGNDK